MARSTRTVAGFVAAAVSAALILTPAAPAPAQSGPAWPALAVGELTPVSARLAWSSPTSDPEVSYYRIYRVTTRNGQPYEQFVNASTSPSFLAALLTPDTEYTYFVETGDATSNGLRSERVTFRTPPAPDDAEPPSAPGVPVASDIGPHSLALGWAPSTDNDGVVAYHVYRTRWQGTAQRAAVVSAVGGNDAPGWSFDRLLPDLEYEFFVVAVDAAGNQSPASPVLSLRTPAHPASACEVSYTATDLGGMFEGQIHLVNTGTVHDVWTIRFTLPAGQQVLFGAAQSGTEAIIWYEGWSNLLTLGEETFTFYGTHSGSLAPATDFRLNGQPCAQ